MELNFVAQDAPAVGEGVEVEHGFEARVRLGGRSDVIVVDGHDVSCRIPAIVDAAYEVTVEHRRPLSFGGTPVPLLILIDVVEIGPKVRWSPDGHEECFIGSEAGVEGETGEVAQFGERTASCNFGQDVTTETIVNVDENAKDVIGDVGHEVAADTEIELGAVAVRAEAQELGAVARGGGNAPVAIGVLEDICAFAGEIVSDVAAIDKGGGVDFDGTEAGGDSAAGTIGDDREYVRDEGSGVGEGEAEGSG